MLCLFLMTKYQATNITEAYMTKSHIQATKVLRDQDQTLQLFKNDALSYACGKGYQVIDIKCF